MKQYSSHTKDRPLTVTMDTSFPPSKNITLSKLVSPLKYYATMRYKLINLMHVLTFLSGFFLICPILHSKTNNNSSLSNYPT